MTRMKKFRLTSFATGSAFGIALIYLLVSVLWIVFSDRLLHAVVQEQELLSLIQTYKGLAFVVVSAVLLFVLVRRPLVFAEKTGRALAEENSRYRQLFEVNPQPMMIYDLETLKFLAVNETAVHKYGYGREEFLAMTLPDLHPPEEHERLRENVARVTGGLDHAGIWQHQKKNGEIILTDIVSHTLEFEGRPAELFHAHDVTEVKRSERKLKENQDFLEAVLDNLPIGIAVNSVEPTVSFAYMNDNFARFYRTTRQALADPDSFWEVVYEDPEFREEMKARVIRDCASGDPERMFWPEIPLVRKGEETTYITARNTPILNTRMTISAVWDVTEQMRLAAQYQQAQKMESIGRLAGGVAHDYNNMLSIIIGYTQLALLKTPAEHPVNKQLQEIMKAAQRSAALTSQLLAFARQQAISPKILDINRTIAGMLKMLRQLIGENIDLLWQPGDISWHVKMDPSQLDQLLTNLCINARDAIDDVGKVTIETDVILFDEAYCAKHVGFVPGEFVMIAVSDDGCGMDSATVKTIFEPFFTTKKDNGGTGLGLATVYGIVRQNNGFINVYSEPGNGTAIKVYLPACDEHLIAEAHSQQSETPKGQGERILLVDDEEALVTLAGKMLEQLGYDVITANTPAEAMHLARQTLRPIELLLTDVVMPEMNGRELSNALQQLCPQLKTLYMSGYTANVIAHRGVLEDNVNFIQKPLFMDELAMKIRTVLDGETT